MSDSVIKPLTPVEGLGVLHLFYTINRSLWEALGEEAQAAGRAELQELVDAARGWPDFQVVTMSMFAKADLGFMLIGKDLQRLQELEKRIARSLGPDVLQLRYSFFSLTEKSEYTTTEEEYKAEITGRDKLVEGTPEYELKMTGYRERIKHYTHDRMYPRLPQWEFFCFYPMLKRRDSGQNWYSLPFEQRKDLMKGHATVGRKYSGKVLQLISGSTGLDDWEWGVSLFAHDPHEIKAIVYEMRFDPVTAHYGEFGEFYTGLPLGLQDIYVRLGL